MLATLRLEGTPRALQVPTQILELDILLSLGPMSTGHQRVLSSFKCFPVPCPLHGKLIPEKLWLNA